MQKSVPELRYTRYSGKFPIEGMCTACPNITFTAVISAELSNTPTSAEVFESGECYFSSAVSSAACRACPTKFSPGSRVK
jgi:hypothetical protein